ncbi:toll/interleukin-1 receptor domain-containing protein (plasmid) [Tistrella mobilis]|uniref:toll/interleukin-1 receptor domain-containing protein n=1 Tax=Tistrella mobilis TaxID=171437 RepID=UPI003558F515
MQTPTVFISYSHDSDAHKEWVYQLACRLVENGVEVVLDQWNIQLGSNIFKFMENGLTNSDRVLVVCTDNYNHKSNEGVGGVGYEKNILTAELFSSQDTNKFIPCIRDVSTKFKTPVYLGGRTYIDFTEGGNFDSNLTQLLHELFAIPLKPKPILGKSPFAPMDEDALPSIRGESSTMFFSNRFSSAFPGVRGIQWFRQPHDAVERLQILFRNPFVFHESTPIWWWRDGNMYINSFDVLAADTVLLDHQELVIDELAAVNAGAYYRSFIYIKTKPSEPTGLYDPASVPSEVEHCGYAREEFGIFRGRPVTRAEYDDGSTVIDGKVVHMGREVELRVRYVTPYNLLIAPHGSPINNDRFDQQRSELLNSLLRGEASLDTLVGAVLQLPKMSRA